MTTTVGKSIRGPLRDSFTPDYEVMPWCAKSPQREDRAPGVPNSEGSGACCIRIVGANRNPCDGRRAPMSTLESPIDAE